MNRRVLLSMWVFVSVSGSGWGWGCTRNPDYDDSGEPGTDAGGAGPSTDAGTDVASPSDVATFHAPDYVDFLQRVAPGNTEELAADVARYAHGDDCPIFPGLWPYCALDAGGSIGGAVTLNHGSADVAINWAGGLHHAKKAEASGFCYVNDIVLAILELLKHHDR